MARTKKVKTEEVKTEDINAIVKCKVLKDFTDKYTKELYKKDTELEITNKRFNEIIEKNKELIRKIGK